MTSTKKPQAEIRLVTPTWAREMLTKHEQAIASGKFRQRHLNNKTVAQYAQDMKAGNWALNGEGLSFDVSENLLNGQHRLAAVVRANVSVQMLVTWDLQPEVNHRLKTIDTFDVGKKRNLAQQLAMEGFTYYAEVGTAARMLLILAAGGSKQTISSPQGITVATVMKANIMRVLHLLAANSAPKSKFRGAVIAPLVLLRSTEPEAADRFATSFNSMVDLSAKSPVLQFARFLDRPSHAHGGTDYQILVMKALCSALYHHTTNKNVEVIRGNDEHMAWLLKTAAKTVAQIRGVAGLEVPEQEKRNQK